MQFRSQTLDNGLEIIAECNEEARSTSLGFFVRTGARDETDDVAVSERAAALGLVAMPLSSCYCGEPDRRGLVLGYGAVPVEEVAEAVERLRRVL